MPSIKLGTCIRCGGADAIEILEENDGLCFACAGGLDDNEYSSVEDFEEEDCEDFCQGP